MSLLDIGDKIVSKIKEMLPTFNAERQDDIIIIQGMETGAIWSKCIDNDSKSFFSLDSAITSVNGDTGTLGWIKNSQETQKLFILILNHWIIVLIISRS